MSIGNKRLFPNDLKPAEQVRVPYCAFPPIGTTKEDLLSTQFWMHVAKSLRAGDKIEVVPDGNAFYAELYVVESSDLWAKMAIISFVDLAPAVNAEVPKPDEGTEALTVEHMGRKYSWCVIRGTGAGKTVIKDGFQTQEAALAHARDYRKALAR